MSRLFISEKEIKFISDITKEVIKDIVGQKIYYYPISEIKTKSHEIYNEAIQKIFDNPIEIDALVDAHYQQESKINKFTFDAQYKLEVFLQYRDLIEKGITVTVGDYFTYSDITYEISDQVIMRNIYGLAEQRDGVKLTGTKVRDSQFKVPVIKGPTDISYSDEDAVQKVFKQQRGYSEIDGEPTGDVRELVKDGILELPEDGPREVSIKGDESGINTSFYDE